MRVFFPRLLCFLVCGIRFYRYEYHAPSGLKDAELFANCDYMTNWYIFGAGPVNQRYQNTKNKILIKRMKEVPPDLLTGVKDQLTSKKLIIYTD